MEINMCSNEAEWEIECVECGSIIKETYNTVECPVCGASTLPLEGEDDVPRLH